LTALADPKNKARLADPGGEAFASSPDEFVNFIAAETEKWAKVVKFAGIKPESTKSWQDNSVTFRSAKRVRAAREDVEWSQPECC
jgi:hypothetical protein